MKWVYRYLSVALVCNLLVFWSPSASLGFAGISIRIISYGPLSISINLLSLLLLLFDSDRVSGAYYASMSRQETAPYSGPSSIEEKLSIKIKSDDYLSGDVFKIKHYKIVKNGVIVLPNGGKLIVQDDGKLRFYGLGVEGYMLLHYNKTLSVWDSNDKNKMVIHLDNQGRIFFVGNNQDECAQLIGLLFGSRR